MGLIRKRKYRPVIGMLILFWCAFWCAPAVFAGEWKLYPGANVDEPATRESRDAAAAAKMTHVQSTVYTTSDSFSSVASFYKGIATEYMMPRASGTTGKPKKYETYELYEAYFIFDGAKDLADSKLWVKVQRPFIGGDVRDVTAIVMTEKKK
ncbi:MAG: hypothetical protein NC930_09625 [Candidatus Omnitrophica bacterium]|nr:hypothetical protein [Candidatus Omnitrophota bacterium]